MISQHRIHGHGYHLILLSTFGLVCTGTIGLAAVCMPYLTDGLPVFHRWAVRVDFDWGFVRGMGASGKPWLSLASACWSVAYLLPLVALRHLGLALRREEALTAPVAGAFQRLAHTLPLHALFCFLAGVLTGVAAEIGGTGPHVYSFDLGRIYLIVIAGLCLYSIAHLMRLAVGAADDARSIV